MKIQKLTFETPLIAETYNLGTNECKDIDACNMGRVIYEFPEVINFLEQKQELLKEAEPTQYLPELVSMDFGYYRIFEGKVFWSTEVVLLEELFSKDDREEELDFVRAWVTNQLENAWSYGESNICCEDTLVFKKYYFDETECRYVAEEFENTVEYWAFLDLDKTQIEEVTEEQVEQGRIIASLYLHDDSRVRTVQAFKTEKETEIFAEIFYKEQHPDIINLTPLQETAIYVVTEEVLGISSYMLNAYAVETAGYGTEVHKYAVFRNGQLLTEFDCLEDVLLLLLAQK